MGNIIIMENISIILLNRNVYGSVKIAATSIKDEILNLLQVEIADKANIVNFIRYIIDENIKSNFKK